MDIVIKPFSDLYASISSMDEICKIDLMIFGEGAHWEWVNFKKELEFKNELSFLAFVKSKMVGYIVCSAYKNGAVNNAHVNRIAIDPDFKFHGIGNRLMKAFENSAYELGITILTLEFDEKMNVDSFYRKNGYMQIREEEKIENYLSNKNKLAIKNEYLSFRRKIFYKDNTL